jgi:hypothetical protein
MAKKDKKQKDKKLKKRRERKGKLPSSVEALLGYLGGGGPGPASQGNTKVRERAGVDAYDTLHQIIKSQQLMSANYMANLERMAFKTEITEQLKKQGEEGKKVLEDTKAEVRRYTKQSTEAQIDAVNRKIAYQLRLQKGPDEEKLSKLYADKQRYEGMLQFETGINQRAQLPSAVGIEPSQASKNVRAGGHSGNSKVSVATAKSSAQLPSTDPTLGFIAERMGPLSPAPKPALADSIDGGLSSFNFSDLPVSSGDLMNVVQMGRTERKQQAELKRMQSQLFLGTGVSTRRTTTNKSI